MCWLSKKTDTPLPPAAQRGSALTVVIFFAAIGMITVFGYLYHQFTFSRHSLSSPSSLQALLHARSGIYKAFYLLIDSTQTDTLKTISTLDSTFGSDMFSGVIDTKTTSETETPEIDGTPVHYELFGDDSTTVGECEVTLEPSGGSLALRSTGRFRSFERTVAALIGSQAPALPDTVVLYRNTYSWQQPPSGGTVVPLEDSMTINASWYNQLVDRYVEELSESDTFLLDPPLVIQSSHDIRKIKPVVQGPLLIDGAHLSVNWKDTGTIVIKGDLQITGEANIEGVRFIVAGEVKILDEANLINVNIFTRSRLFIGDQAVYNGNAIAMHSIAVYGRAAINGKSSLIAGSPRRVSSGRKASDSLHFSLLLSEESTIDAVCIALGTPGSIKTDQNTTITGILWAQHIVCHRGQMSGLITAGRVVDCDDPEQMVTNESSGIAPLPEESPGKGGKKSVTTPPTTVMHNAIPGLIEPLPEISMYHLPFFIGRLSIISWREE